MQRNKAGLCVIELLIASVIGCFICIAFLGVIYVVAKTYAKTDNMQDNINAMRTVKERISQDLREGRSLGDVYGTDNQDNSVTPAVFYVSGSDSFPSSHDPIYGTLGTPPKTPSGWPSQPWKLSNQCLIVQVPILDDHNDSATMHRRNTSAVGWPTQIPPNANFSDPQDNVETHVYMVVPDPDTINHPNESVLQFASFGGAGSSSTQFSGYNQSVHTYGPVTMLTGIVGPAGTMTTAEGTTSSGPKVFQFVDAKLAPPPAAEPNSSTPQDGIITPGAAQVAEYTGVVVNLEIRRHQDMSLNRKDISTTPVGFKLEAFLRNNALATSCGQPAGDQ